MGKNLVIVESPSKSKTIEKYLGKDFKVVSSKGHICDLATSGKEGLGIDVDHDFAPTYTISKDKKELLVVELKRGRTSDAVVGQILRYMGFVKEMLCDEGQTVRGAIVALEDDQRIRRALSMVDNVSFFRYKINFRLEQAC